MNVKNVSDRELAWIVGMHLLFVISGLLMALTDRLSEHPKPGGDAGGH